MITLTFSELLRVFGAERKSFACFEYLLSLGLEKADADKGRRIPYTAYIQIATACCYFKSKDGNNNMP